MFIFRTLALPLLIFSLSLPAHASSTFRCNSALVSLGADTHEVRSKCGEPINTEHQGFKLRTNHYGHTHELRVEEWIYGPKGGMYYYLQFEGGHLSKISSSR